MRKRKLISTLFFFAAVFLASGCLKESFGEVTNPEEPDNNEPEPVENKYADFDFRLVTDYQIDLRTLDFEDQALAGVYMELFTQDPLNEQGVLTEESQKYLAYSGITNAQGRLVAHINPPTTSDSLYIIPYYLGLAPSYVVPLQGNDISLVLGGKPTQPNGVVQGETRSLGNPPSVSTVNGFYVLGSWTSYGRPNYLEASNDVISTDFLERVNASLPERSRLPESHPDYLASDDDANLELIEDAEVFVTVVTEGAGFRNVLGYYTYPTNNPPTSVNDLIDLTIIFPDVSVNTGAWLTPGNKVQLYYLDQETNTYTDVFPEGTSVGWFVIANGWNSFSGDTYFSTPAFNPEPTAEKRKHNVLLWDEDTERLLLGFEDLNRQSGSDEDFNDAVFFATVTPTTAVDLSNYQPVDDDIDEDDDGVSDLFDDYPEDPTRAFDNPYPSENGYASLVFEDLWPSRGDYDFNDLVIDYRYNPVTNSQNQIVSLEAKVKLKAIGASYHNAFGVQLDIPWDKVASVTGNRITENYLTMRANGTELQQDQAVIFFFDNAYRVLDYPGSGIGINTEENAPYVEPVELTVQIEFTEPISISQVGPPPYNPFIVINRQRGVEVHLPEKTPTDLADLSLFGTGDDDSNIATGKYYMSDSNLPWGLNIPSDFEYPVEKRVITNTYLKFDEWAVSRGAQFNDWYENKSGYKNLSFVYRHN